MEADFNERGAWGFGALLLLENENKSDVASRALLVGDGLARDRVARDPLLVRLGHADVQGQHQHEDDAAHL